MPDTSVESWKQNYDFKTWRVNTQKEIEETLRSDFQRALDFRDVGLATALDNATRDKTLEDFNSRKQIISAMADDKYCDRLLKAIEEREGSAEDADWTVQARGSQKLIWARIQKREESRFAGGSNVAGPSSIPARAHNASTSHPMAGPSMVSQRQPRLAVPPVNIEQINEETEETSDDSSSGNDEDWQSDSQDEPSVHAGRAGLNNYTDHGRSGDVPPQRSWIPPPTTEPALSPARDRPHAPGNPTRRVSVPPTGRPMSGASLSRQASLNSTYARPSPMQWAPPLPTAARPPSPVFSFRPGPALGQQPRAMQGSAFGAGPTPRRNERPQRGPPAPLEGWTPPTYNADPRARPISQTDWTRWATEGARTQPPYRGPQAWRAPTQQARSDNSASVPQRRAPVRQPQHDVHASEPETVDDDEFVVDLEYERQNFGPWGAGSARSAGSNATGRQETTLEEDINWMLEEATKKAAVEEATKKATVEEAMKKAAESKRMMEEARRLQEDARRKQDEAWQKGVEASQREVEAMQREQQARRAEERVNQREQEVRTRELGLGKKQGDVTMREAKVLVKEEAIKQQEVELERKRQEAQAASNAHGLAVREEVAEDEARLREEKQKQKEEELERKEIEIRHKEMDLRWKEEEVKKREEGLNRREAAISLREEQEEQRKAEAELKRRAEERKQRAEEDRRRLAQVRNGRAEEESRKVLEEQRAKDAAAKRDREAAEQRQREEEQRRSEEQKEREEQEAQERNLGPSPEHCLYRQSYVRHAAALKRTAATANFGGSSRWI